MNEAKFTPGPWKADESYCLGAVNAGKRLIADRLDGAAA